MLSVNNVPLVDFIRVLFAALMATATDVFSGAYKVAGGTALLCFRRAGPPGRLDFAIVPMAEAGYNLQDTLRMIPEGDWTRVPGVLPAFLDSYMTGVEFAKMTASKAGDIWKTLPLRPDAKDVAEGEAMGRGQRQPPIPPMDPRFN